MKVFFRWLVETILYQPVQVDYIRFAQHNEYLLIKYQRRLGIGPKTWTSVERKIGNWYGRYFSPKVYDLKQKGIEVNTKIMTLDEFTEFAKGHPLLQKDSWVKMRLSVVAEHLAIQEIASNPSPVQ